MTTSEIQNFLSENADQRYHTQFINGFEVEKPLLHAVVQASWFIG